MSTDERRARDLSDNQYFREEGTDDIHRAEKITERGDAVLIDCYDGCEVTLDGDTVVEGHDFSPVEMTGQIKLANGRSIDFRIGNVAGAIAYSQFGEVNEVLWHTVPLLDGLVKAINEDDLLVVPHG